MGLAAETPGGRVRLRLPAAVATALALVVCATGAAPGATRLVASATAPKVVEGKPAVFTVRLSRKAPKRTVLKYRVVAATAKSPGDFKSVTGRLVFKRGQATKKLTVKTVNDTLVEAAETFTLRLAAPRGVTLKKKIVVATILDNDSGTGSPPPTPTLAIADLGVNEGNAGSAQATLTVSLSGAAAAAVSVSYSTVAVSATASSDFTDAGGSVTFQPGETAKQVQVPVLGDTVDEDDETLEVRLATPVGNATIADDRAVLTVLDDDPAVADVGVTLSDAPDPVIAGATITYSATVANAGPDRAPAAVLTDVLPAGLTFVSASASSGICGNSAGTVTCQLGTILSGGSRTVTIVAEPTVSGQIGNTVSVAGAYTDTAAANDQASTTTQSGAGADVSVDLTASASTLLAGQNLTYMIQAANRGPFAAVNPVVTDTLPAGVTFVSATPGCVHSAGTVTCGAGALGTNLAPDASIPLQIVVTRSDPVDATLDNAVSIAASSPEDPDLADNADATSTPYHAAADLNLSAINSGEPVVPGADLSWTLTLANVGPNDAAAVSLHDTVPAGYTLESVTPSQGLCTPAILAVDCTFGTLASGATVTIVLAGRPSLGSIGTTLTNTASVTSSTADPVTANNSVTNPVKVQPTISINSVQANEPIGVFPLAGIPKTTAVTFTITLSQSSPEPVSLAWATEDGTATAGLDYWANWGTLVFAPGETVKQVQVTVVSDGVTDLPEFPDEAFRVNLSDVVNATVVNGQGVCTILD